MLLVFWISHSLHDCFCFCALGLGLFDGSGFEGMRVLGVLGVSLFDPMTLKPGTAASRSVSNSLSKSTDSLSNHMNPLSKLADFLRKSVICYVNLIIC